MKTIYLRTENHWRGMGYHSPINFALVLFGVTIVGLRAGVMTGHLFFAVEVLNFEASLHT